MKKPNLIRAAFAVLVTLACLSCDKLPQYKPLCLDHSHMISLNVKFDWKYCPEAYPEIMRVWFYDLDNPEASPVPFECGPEGGVVRLMFGRYQVIAYNYDTETILYRNTENVDFYEAYTRRSSIAEGSGVRVKAWDMPKAEGSENQDVILEPEPLYAANLEEVVLNIGDGEREIVLEPQPRTINIEILMNNGLTCKVPCLSYPKIL